MSRLRLLATIGALAAFCTSAAMPQEAEPPVLHDCEAYHAPYGAGVSRRTMYLLKMEKPFQGQHKKRPGQFLPTPEAGLLAFWTDPLRRGRPNGYFTTRRGKSIKFVPEGGVAEPVTFGKLTDPDEIENISWTISTYIDCDHDPSTPPDRWYTDRKPLLGDLMKKSTPAPAPPPASDKPPTPERGTSRPEAPAPKLGELFKTAPPPTTPPTGPPATAAPPPAGPPVGPPASSAPAPPAAPTASPPARTPVTSPRWDATTVPAAPTAVCRFDTFAAMPFSEGTPPRSAQAYALRNKRTKVPAHDYVDTIGEVLPFPAEVDVSASANRLTPYESVAIVRGKTTSTWVSIPGAKLVSAAPEAARPRPKATLRLLIVSGAQELLISGLDRVGAELAKASAIDVQPKIDWHLVEPNGDLKPAVRFTSFQALMEAAAENTRGERMDVLSEAQLMKMLDQFEALLLAQPAPLDRVLWIKGAYPIPGTFPPRLEAFLTRVAESNALTKLVSGRPGKWFTIVTARILGFSIAYLKEPVYSLQAGDVLEEDPAAIGAKRSLIPDIGLFATRLRTGLKTETTPETADVNAPTRLVQDAADVFSERGYILSRAETASLHAYLREVVQLWTEGDRLDAAILAKFARGLYLADPVTLQDLLHGGKPGRFPRVPRASADILRKPVSTLTPKELHEARALANRYLEGVAAVAGSLTGEKAQKCGSLFVTEEALGIVGNSR